MKRVWFYILCIIAISFTVAASLTMAAPVAASGSSLRNLSARLTAFDCLLWAVPDSASVDDALYLKKMNLWIENDSKLDERYEIRSVMRQCVGQLSQTTVAAGKDFFRAEQTTLGYFLQNLAFGLVGHQKLAVRPTYRFAQLLSGGRFMGSNHLAQMLSLIVAEMNASPACCRLVKEQAERITSRRDAEMSRQMVAKMASYTGQDKDAESTATSLIYLDATLPTGSGSSLRLGGFHLILAGPFDSEVKQNIVIYHELAHQPVHDAIRRHPKLGFALASTHLVFEAIQRSGIDLYSYDTWTIYFEEMVVRAISYQLAQADALTNYPLEASLIRSFAHFVPGKTSLADFLETVLSRLTVKDCKV